MCILSGPGRLPVRIDFVLSRALILQKEKHGETVVSRISLSSPWETPAPFDPDISSLSFLLIPSHVRPIRRHYYEHPVLTNSGRTVTTTTTSPRVRLRRRTRLANQDASLSSSVPRFLEDQYPSLIQLRSCAMYKMCMDRGAVRAPASSSSTVSLLWMMNDDAFIENLVSLWMNERIQHPSRDWQSFYMFFFSL